MEDTKYETGRKLTGERELNERAQAAIAKLRETVARLEREQKDDRDHIRMQGDAIVRLSQELADERTANSVLLRYIETINARLRLPPTKLAEEKYVGPARDGLEAMHGLNDTYPGDPYPGPIGPERPYPE